MSVVGETIPQLDLPVCNKFRPKMIEGQLCYQIDVNEVKDQIDVKKAIQHGLIFVMDYNEDKMITENISVSEEKPNKELHEKLIVDDKTNDARIFLEMIGNKLMIKYVCNIGPSNVCTPALWICRQS